MLWHKNHYIGSITQFDVTPDADRGDICHRVRTDFGES
jgi:hypothetical protein